MKITLISILSPLVLFGQAIKFDLGRNIAINEGVVCSFQPFYHPEPVKYQDIDGDGLLDAFISGNSIDLFNRNSFLYLQNSLGNYSAIPTPFKYTNVSSEFGDVDGDGDLDLIISGSTKNGTYVSKLYLNDGNGNYNTTLPLPVPTTFKGQFKFADVDGDGDLDLFFIGFDAGNNAQTKLCINDGNGNFTVSNFVSFQKAHSGSIAFADLDGDGDLDLFYTGKQYSNRYAYLYLNDGNGNYTIEISSSFVGVTNSTLAFEDIDGDSDLDLIYTGLPDGLAPDFITKLYINDGNGVFTENSTAPILVNEHTSFHFEDINGDNVKELIFINNRKEDGANNEIYVNDGTGNFTLSTSFYLKANLHTITFSDLDGDNDLDITDAKTATFYINDGNGNFSESKNLSEGTIALGDIDGDNDLDLLVTGLNTSYFYTGLTPTLIDKSIVTKIYLNDGNGFYTEATGSPIEAVTQSKAKFFDVNGDGNLDLFIIGLTANNTKIAQLYLNDGNGDFTLSTSTFNGVIGDFDYGDYDGDGDVDIVIVGSNNAAAKTVTMYANDGNGNFSNQGSLNLLALETGTIRFADVDNNNTLDLFISGYESATSQLGLIYLNDGNGSFTQSTGDTLSDAYLGGAEFADIDGDDDIDLIVSGKNTGTVLYKNDGNGVFTIFNNTSLKSAYKGALAFGDMDKDGDVDLFISGEIAPNVVHTSYYNNDGDGNYILFVDSVFSAVSNSAIAIGNIDPDSLNEVIYLGRKESNYATKSVLKIHNVTGIANSGSETVFACNDYTWQNGIVYSATGSYDHTFTNIQGCDSVTTLALTIGTLETVITFANDTISPTFTGDSYQWLDCNSNTAIANATDSLYIPTANGIYALIMTQGACADTSNCVAIAHLSVEENELNLSALVYPNPSTDNITIQTDDNAILSFILTDLNGKVLIAQEKLTANETINIEKLASGIYLLQIRSENKTQTIQLIKQ